MHGDVVCFAPCAWKYLLNVLQLEVFVYGGIHSATPDRVLNDGWILDTHLLRMEARAIQDPVRGSEEFALDARLGMVLRFLDGVCTLGSH